MDSGYLGEWPCDDFKKLNGELKVTDRVRNQVPTGGRKFVTVYKKGQFVLYIMVLLRQSKCDYKRL